MFNDLTAQQKRLLAVPPGPWVLRVAIENLDFERAMLSLAACSPCDLQALKEAFKKFARSKPWPWRDTALDSREYFLAHGRFPFEISDSP